jgi:hypothetical protein
MFKDARKTKNKHQISKQKQMLKIRAEIAEIYIKNQHKELVK